MNVRLCQPLVGTVGRDCRDREHATDERYCYWVLYRTGFSFKIHTQGSNVQ